MELSPFRMVCTTVPCETMKGGGTTTETTSIFALGDNSLGISSMDFLKVSWVNIRRGCFSFILVNINVFGDWGENVLPSSIFFAYWRG
jgi:hypothetical protein